MVGRWCPRGRYAPPFRLWFVYSPHAHPAGGFLQRGLEAPRYVGGSQGRYDEILIDSPAGLGAGFRLATMAAAGHIVVAVRRPSSLRDAQRVVGQLGRASETATVVRLGPPPPAAGGRG
ncbi:MAG: hypothetical protein ACLUNZ_02120 [Evtepia sp.]